MERQKEEAAQKLSNVQHQLEMAKIEVEKPFEKEAELAEKMDRLNELNALLNMDEKGDEVLTLDEETPVQDTANTDGITEPVATDALSEEDKRIEEEKQNVEKCDICGADTGREEDSKEERIQEEAAEETKPHENNPVIPVINGKPSVLAKLKVMKGVAEGRAVYHQAVGAQHYAREAL